MNIIFQVHENGGTHNLWKLEPLRVNFQSFETSCAIEIITTPEQEEMVSHFADFLYDNKLLFKDNVDVVLVPDNSTDIMTSNYIFTFLPVTSTTTVCITTPPKSAGFGESTTSPPPPRDLEEFFSKFKEESPS